MEENARPPIKKAKGIWESQEDGGGENKALLKLGAQLPSALQDV